MAIYTMSSSTLTDIINFINKIKLQIKLNIYYFCVSYFIFKTT